jgi:hypothetical protein
MPINLGPRLVSGLAIAAAATLFVSRLANSGRPWTGSTTILFIQARHAAHSINR